MIVWKPNTFFEDLLHPCVRKLFLHVEEATLYLQWENLCWTCQFLVAFEIKTIKSEAKRVPRPFEPFGLYQVTIEESELVTETDSALNNDQLLSKNHGNLMLPDRGIPTPSTSADMRRHKHFSWILHFSNSGRMHWIIIVLLPFLISIGWTSTGWCKLILYWAPFIFTQFVTHALSPVVFILKGLYFGSLLGICNMSFLIADRCDIVCIWYNDNFLTRGAAKFKSEQFSEFGSQTVT